MAIKTIRVFQEFTSAGYVPMPVAGNIDYGVTIANTFPATTPTTFQTDDPDIDVTLTATTDYYVWIRSHGTDWNPMYTRNVRVYPDSPLINNVVMGIIIANLDGTVPYVGATTNVDLGEFGLKAGYLGLDLTPTATPTTVGTMSWNDADGTVDLKLKGGNVTLQVGQEQVTRIVNKTGANLLEANYQAVRVSGAQGNRLKVDLAQANLDANSAETLGLVTETINNNQEGFITTSGLVRNIDTTGTLQGETWADGDILYLSGTTAGRITNVKPQAPTHSVIMGYVVRAHQTQGQIYVKVDNGYELDELHNVKIIGALNKDVLVYNSTTKLWENRIIFKTQGYLPYYDDTLLLNNSPLYTNGNNVAIGSLTLTEKLVVGGNVLANQFKKVGGLSTEFLKADGSSDATAYQPLSADLTAIDNLALTTGLLRKNGLNTWELDQTEYLSVAIAGSTYQTLANLSSNLTASTIKYPSVNAVNAGLALKLNLTGGTLTGGLTLNYSYPNIALSDVSSGTTWNIQNDGSTFKLNYGATNNFYIFSSGNAAFVNSLTASSLIKSGGTSTQFLKADGSVDNTNYQPYDADLASIAGLELTTGLLRKNGLNTYTLDQTEYVALSTANSTYQTLANLQSNLNASSTKYPSVNAVNTGLNLKLNLAGGTLTGDLALAYSYPNIQLSDTSSGTIWNIQNDGGGFEINSGITNKFVMYSSGNATFVNDLTANKFIKSGGTSSQFLMADGSVSSGNAGTVTSVGLSAPTGFSVSSSPVTTSGTLALAFSVGYSLPSDATQATWTAKQNALNGTGFVKISGTTISYDNSTYYLASNPSGFTSNVGTVTSVAMSVPTGLSISGTPITTSGTLALSLTAGYSIPTTSSQGTWDTAYNRSLTSIGVSGTTTKTLTLTKQDGTTLTASWSDINTDAVTSVFGRTGAIVATSGDYTTAQVTESGNLYYLDSRARASISGGTGISYNSTTGVITNTITQYTDALARASLSFVAGSGAYNSTTGVITIPTNTSQLINGAGYITGITSGMVTTALGYTPVTNARQLTINGTTYDLSADRSWTISGTIGGLTSGFIPKATSASTLGNSLIYDNGTNVGIGTSSPNASYRTSISGSAYLVGTDAKIYIDNGGVGGASAIIGAVGTSYGYLNTDGGFPFVFQTNNTERMRLTSGGNLLVGTQTGYSNGITIKGSSDDYALTIAQSNASNAGWGQWADTSGNYKLSRYGGGTYSSPALTITLAGLATFISSVSATQFNATFKYAWGTATNGTTGQVATDNTNNYFDYLGNLYFRGASASNTLMTLTSAGNLGLGTSSPGEKLTINGYVGLQRSGTQIWHYGVDSSNSFEFVRSGISTRMILSSDGNLGLGVTPSAWNTGYRAMQITSWSTFASDFSYNGATEILTNAYIGTASASNYIYTNSAASTRYKQVDGIHSWSIAPSGTAGTAISFTQAMTLDASGNLGVGIASPSNRLHIYGTDGNSYIRWTSDVATTGTRIGYNGTEFRIDQQQNADVTIRTNGSERVRVFANGNVAINTTTDSGYKLDVNGTGRFSGALSTFGQLRLEPSTYGSIVVGSRTSQMDFQIYNTSNVFRIYNGTNDALSIATGAGAATFSSSVTATRYYITPNGSNTVYNIVNSDSTYAGSYIMQAGGGSAGFGGGLITYGHSHATKPGWVTAGISVGSGGKFSVNNQGLGGGTDLFVVESSTGNVGIGTTDPSNYQLGGKFVVAGATSGFYFNDSSNRLVLDGAGTTRDLTFYFRYSNSATIASDSSLIFSTGGTPTEKMRITSGGNVLIGTTTDAGYKLNVSGNIAVNSRTILQSSSIVDNATNGNNIGIGFGSAGIVPTDGSGNYSVRNLGTLSLPWGSLFAGAATFSSSVTATSFFESSDKTIKTLITDNYSVKGIESITAKLYTKHGKEELGYFAQDVQGILPSAVTKGTNGLLNLSYREVLVAKVQRLEKELEELKAKMN